MSKILILGLAAKTAHELNRAYCLSLGDDTQPAWEDAPDWQRESAQIGVEMHLANPDATPEQSHESWLKQKVADGWVYGEVKDAEAKTHPCCVPYAELPAEQKAKDYIFRAAVHAVKAIADEVAAAVPSAAAVVAAAAPSAPGLVPVTYIGRREHFVDRLYGSALSFEKGQSRSLPPDLATQFLRHGDLFARATEAVSAKPAADTMDAETQAGVDRANGAKAAVDQEQNSLHELRSTVNNMTKEALLDFAKVKYGQSLKRADSVATLRTAVIGMIDQFGAR